MLEAAALPTDPRHQKRRRCFWPRRRCCTGNKMPAASLATVVFLWTFDKTMGFLTCVPRGTTLPVDGHCCSNPLHSPQELHRRAVGNAAADAHSRVIFSASAVAAASVAAAAPDVAAPPRLVSEARDVETYFGRYRVRARREEERAVDGIADAMVPVVTVAGPVGEKTTFDDDGSGEDIPDDGASFAGDATAAANLGRDVDSNGVVDWAHREGGGDEKRTRRYKRPLGKTAASDIWTAEDSRILVFEDMSGGLLGFCGVVGPHTATATTPIPGTYIFARQGCEIHASTANLLVRALHGWVGGPAAAATAAKRFAAREGVTRHRGAGVGAGAESAGYDEEHEEESEMVDWVDTKGRVICALPRPMVHSHNVLHRGAGVMIRNKKGEVYCHRRTSTKRVFPSMYDMFIGGVSGTLEPSVTTAVRELGEELGLGPCGGGSGGGLTAEDSSEKENAVLMPASMFYRGECLVQTSHNRCVVSVFDYRVGAGETVTWQEEEVEWGSFISWEQVVSKVSEGSWDFVPDGLQVWQHYLEWETAARPTG